jgi:hypothetical protein
MAPPTDVQQLIEHVQQLLADAAHTRRWTTALQARCSHRRRPVDMWTTQEALPTSCPADGDHLSSLGTLSFIRVFKWLPPSSIDHIKNKY